MVTFIHYKHCGSDHAHGFPMMTSWVSDSKGALRGQFLGFLKKLARLQQSVSKILTRHQWSKPSLIPSVNNSWKSNIVWPLPIFPSISSIHPIERFREKYVRIYIFHSKRDIPSRFLSAWEKALPAFTALAVREASSPLSGHHHLFL